MGDEWRSHLGKDFICSAVTAIACPDPVAAAVLNAIDQGDRQLLQIVLVRYRSEQHPTPNCIGALPLGTTPYG